MQVECRFPVVLKYGEAVLFKTFISGFKALNNQNGEIELNRRKSFLFFDLADKWFPPLNR